MLGTRWWMVALAALTVVLGMSAGAGSASAATPATTAASSQPQIAMIAVAPGVIEFGRAWR
jgi:hypothetical protein